MFASVMSPDCQFHNDMEEFSKALVEKKYVNAANQLERVRAASTMSTQPVFTLTPN